MDRGREGKGCALHSLEWSQSSPPVILSSIQFPTQPSGPSSSSAAGDKAPKYRHVLASKAISPQMDLVAIVSRDAAAASSASTSSSGGANPASVLPPPPPGMSAAANQARMRMLMMARARALAAAGGAGKGGSGAASGATDVPKVTRSASLRLSLWRMASITGEQGTRVWDVEIKLPDLFAELGKDVKENENIEIGAISWSPDCTSIALTADVTRIRRIGDAEDRSSTRKNRFLLLYAMQDGKQERLLRVPENVGRDGGKSSLFGIVWKQLRSQRKTKRMVSEACFESLDRLQLTPSSHQPGSVEYIIEKLANLPDTGALLEDKEGKNRQRQRAMNAMRGGSQKQGETDLKIEALMQSKTDDWTIALLDYPRSFKEQDKEKSKTAEILCVWDASRLYLFLDACIFLGSIASDGEITTVELDPYDSSLSVACRSSPRDTTTFAVYRQRTDLDAASPLLSPLLHLQSLSTILYDLLSYIHDSLVDSRNLYRTTHISCITPWIHKGKSVERKYSTHFPSEMQMLLLTSSANEIITSILVGNETMTEGDLNKHTAEIASAWYKMEVLIDAVLQALQRCAIIYEELRGCCLWQESYGAFLTPEEDGKAIEGMLDAISLAQQQTFTSLRHIQQEARCWAQFYKWFKFERTRQEAIRDQLAEPKMDSPIDVLLIVEFLQRGFVNYHLEQSIGIVLDRNTRGLHVEDEEEDEEHKQDESEIQEGREEFGFVETSFLDTEKIGKGVDQHEEVDLGGDSLQHFLDGKLRDLKRLPIVAHGTDRTTTRGVPSGDDISRLVTSPFILTGPAAGLQSRQRQSSAQVNLMQVAKDLLATSSSLFSTAFSRWVATLENEPANGVVTALPSPLLPLRSDSLLSVCQGGSAGVEEASTTYMRSCFDEKAGHIWFLCVGRDVGDDQSVDGKTKNLLVVSRMDRAHSSTLSAAIHCGGSTIIDAGFYSPKQVVLLLQDREQSKLLSFPLDALDLAAQSQTVKMLPSQRCYDLPSSHSTGTQLALNHCKDVAATLDERGLLVYYDLVLLDGHNAEDEEMG